MGNNYDMHSLVQQCDDGIADGGHNYPQQPEQQIFKDYESCIDLPADGCTCNSYDHLAVDAEQLRWYYRKILEHLGIVGFPWAASPKTALMTAVMIDVWVNTSFCMLLVLAGLQSLPKSPFESAKIDGGSTMFNFRNLTLPMLKPSLYIALLFRLMAALQEYAVIFALTKGGPGDTLMNLSLTAYQTGFQFQKFGYALPYILVLWVFINIIAKQIVKRQRAAQKQAAGLEE